ncbi:MAG: hypothetical protein GWN86_04225 [Desulfobacterales bacterium]|nr:hypothetical protein [Desulfobacterales bacterium]
MKDDAPSGALKHGETHASRAIGALSKEELEALPKGSIGQVERITNTLINPQSLDEKLPTPNEINKALMHRIDQVQMQAISKANALLMDEEKLRDLSPTQLIDFVTKLADLKLVLHWTSKLEKVILGDAGKLTAPGQGKATPLLSKLKSLSKSAQKELTQSRKAATGGSKKAPGWMALPPARSG